MFKTLLASIVLGISLTVLTGAYTLNSLAAQQGTQPERAKSPFAGQYAGPFSAKSPFTGLQVGSITLAVKPDGSAEGSVDNTTSSTKASLRGKIDENGSIALDCEYPTTTTKVKGTVRKSKEGHLIGDLTQYRETTVIATIEIELRAK